MQREELWRFEEENGQKAQDSATLLSDEEDEWAGGGKGQWGAQLRSELGAFWQTGAYFWGDFKRCFEGGFDNVQKATDYQRRCNLSSLYSNF
mgnify:CR=1 FL=1